jgi:hypothetical protein
LVRSWTIPVRSAPTAEITISCGIYLEFLLYITGSWQALASTGYEQ